MSGQLFSPQSLTKPRTCHVSEAGRARRGLDCMIIEVSWELRRRDRLPVTARCHLLPLLLSGKGAIHTTTCHTCAKLYTTLSPVVWPDGISRAGLYAGLLSATIPCGPRLLMLTLRGSGWWSGQQAAGLPLAGSYSKCVSLANSADFRWQPTGHPGYTTCRWAIPAPSLAIK